MSSGKQTHPLVVARHHYENNDDEEDDNSNMIVDSNDEAKMQSQFECVGDLYSNLFIVILQMSTDSNVSAQRIKKKLIQYDSNIEKDFYSVKFKKTKPMDCILYSSLQNLYQNNPNIIDEKAKTLNNLKTILTKMESKDVHLVNTIPYIDLIAEYTNEIDIKKVKIQNTPYNNENRELTESHKNLLKQNVFVIQNQNDDFKMNTPPDSADMEFVFSKILFDRNSEIDTKVKRALKDVIYGNIDIVGSTWPDLTKKNIPSYQKYNAAKSVILAVQVKCDPRDSNFEILVDNGKKLSSKMLTLKISNEIIESKSEVKTSVMLQEDFGGRVSRVYPETVYYFKYGKEIVAVMYLMDKYNCDITSFTKQLDNVCEQMSLEQEFKLLLQPVYEAMYICADVKASKGITHLDFKPKNACLKVDYNTSTCVGNNGLMMYAFSIVVIDWGLSHESLIHKMKDGLGPKIIGSPVYIPPKQSETYQKCLFLTFAAGISLLDQIDYTKVNQCRDCLISNDSYDAKMGYLIRNLFHEVEDIISWGISDLLIKCVSRSAIKEVSFLNHDVFYLDSMGIAKELLNKYKSRSDSTIRDMIQLRGTMSKLFEFDEENNNKEQNCDKNKQDNDVNVYGIQTLLPPPPLENKNEIIQFQ